MTKVAIMGYGVVGSGLIELIDKNREKNDNEVVITSILVEIKKNIKIVVIMRLLQQIQKSYFQKRVIL